MNEKTAMEVRMDFVESGILSIKKLHSVDTDKLWKAIDNIRQRPPVWATVVMTLLGVACGWFAS